MTVEGPVAPGRQALIDADAATGPVLAALEAAEAGIEDLADSPMVAAAALRKVKADLADASATVGRLLAAMEGGDR